MTADQLWDLYRAVSRARERASRDIVECSLGDVAELQAAMHFIASQARRAEQAEYRAKQVAA